MRHPYRGEHRRNMRRRMVFFVPAVALLALGVARAQTATRTPGLGAAKAIHQEVIVKAPRARVYEALMNAQQFDLVEKLGVAMRTMPKSFAAPTQIDAAEGGTFVLFGGYIFGRNVELVPNERIVQAWREMPWKPGVYSLVRFELLDDGAGTKILFDHTGFPVGDGAELAKGWFENYWHPLRQSLEAKP
jgi:activator of HSP90 ATPase